MRVLFIANNFVGVGYTGGAEVSAYHTARGLMRLGVECSVLVVNQRMPQACADMYELDGLPVHCVYFHTRNRSAARDVYDQRIAQAVSNELKRLRPDLVHIHNVSGATLAPYVACALARVPVVNTLHDLWLLCPNNMCYRTDGSFCDPATNPRRCAHCFARYDYWGDVPFRRRLFAALTANVHCFIAPSQRLIAQHVKAGFAERRFRLIPYGLEFDSVSEPRHAGVQAIVRTAADFQTVVFAGGGVEIKGARVVADAAPLMLRHIERLRIVVAGGGEEHLLNLLRQYGPAVQLLGSVPAAEMCSLFAVADITLVPSVWHENSPVVIYENFHVGTPVAGSDFGGISELIQDGESGYLFRVGDPIALAEKVIGHFALPAPIRHRMRVRCLRVAETQLTMKRHLDGILNVYQEAIA